ncbi:hypothetical protein IYW40_09175 [Methylocystis sp. H4A]|uniref:hypothetical protein n=1 Tax=Methylocystis sp. H4A TaxID=2785788 RepID=UPI0018C20A64|nr:hypothetical protein [Methylocystis sp. H4A]MBG0801655.1 hypothetical protein [Methylocystis sp. H4A]
MIEEDHVLRPFDASETIPVSIAATIAGVKPRTIQHWCVVYRIGRRIANGPWRVSRPALQMLLDDDGEALRLYHAGDRTSERVRQYFRRAQTKTPQSPQNPQALHGD